METSTEKQRNAAIQLLESWLASRLPDTEYEWLTGRIQQSVQSNSGKDLFITLGLVPRKISRLDLALTSGELDDAESARPGWDPSTWSIAGAARILVVTKVASAQGDAFGTLYKELCRTADVSESIELYNALPLLAASEKIDNQVGEGLRTNMRAVFESIAHRNPYPQETFDENRWNHMVLKALFVDSTLAPIQGLDARANDQLAGILCDYAHERWAANRPVTCELWRCVGPFASGTRLDDLTRALESDNVDEQHAAAIALAQSSDPQAAEILASKPALAASAADGQIVWQNDVPRPARIGSADYA